MIITIVVAVTTLCCSSFCCLFGGSMLLGGGEWSTDLGVPQTGQINPLYGTAPCCLAILIWIVPLLLWVFLVRGAEEEAIVEDAYMEGAYVAEDPVVVAEEAAEVEDTPVDADEVEEATYEELAE